MHRKLSFLMPLIILLSTSFGAYGQTDRFQPSPYVYKVKATDCMKSPKLRTQTGFRVKNLNGVVTALHGVAGCKTILAQSESIGSSLENLTIAQVDLERDVALLWTKELDPMTASGFDVLTTVRDSDYKRIKVVGYPFNLFKQTVANVAVKQTTELGNILPEEDILAVYKRNSPALDIPVLDIQGPLVPGHSGAPLLTFNNRVVGVGSGGLDLGRVEMGWAIPWKDIQWQIVSTEFSSRISQSAIKELARIEKLDPTLVFAFGEVELSDEAKLEQLTPGVSRAKVEELFGVPQIAEKLCFIYREYCPSDLIDRYTIHRYIFNSYSLTVIFDENTLQFYAVTVLAEGFNPAIPAFRYPNEDAKKIGELTYVELTGTGAMQYKAASGAKHVWYWETHDLGGGFGYLTLFLGNSMLTENNIILAQEIDAWQFALDEFTKSQALDNIRAFSKPNTYGFAFIDEDFLRLLETGEYIFFDEILFTNRILMR